MWCVEGKILVLQMLTKSHVKNFTVYLKKKKIVCLCVSEADLLRSRGFFLFRVGV